MRTRTTNSSALITLLSLLLGVSALLAIDFEGGENVTLDGFETRGAGRDGKTEWVLHGGTARLRGGLYELNDIRLIVYLEGGNQAEITSPRCVFDQARGIARSDAPLKVVSQDMTLEGEGYDLATDRKVLRIRSRVKMTVRKVGDHLSPMDVFGDLGKPWQPAPGKNAQDKRENEQR